MAIEIREHGLHDLGPFIQAGHVVYDGDPSWVPQLHFELKERFDPRKNPFFERAEVAIWTAWKNGRLAGRCTAQIDREHLRVWKDDTGFFGFFDTIDDVDVARALIETAAQWLRERGMKKMRGPLSLYINEQVGVLVEGFDTPPVVMAGVCIMIPNLNEAIHDLGGKLFPTGAAKLLWRLKVKRPTSTRLMMLGIRKDITRNVKRYGGLSAAMYVEVAKRGIAKGYKWGELSWTREDDAPINLGIRSMGAKVYKKYRVYQRSLA